MVRLSGFPRARRALRRVRLRALPREVPMSLLPRVRLLLARRPWLYWLFVAVCAGLAWLGVAGAQARVAHQRDQWGATRRIWVAEADLAAGTPVHAVGRDYPVAMLPGSAVTSLPANAVAARPVAAGEVLVAADLAGESTLPAHWLVFAVPGDGAPRLLPGEHVEVFGSGQRWCEGIVAGTTDSHVEVGVDPGCATSMSAQLAVAAVTLARLP